jgi:hypothetical protein
MPHADGLYPTALALIRRRSPTALALLHADDLVRARDAVHSPPRPLPPWGCHFPAAVRGRGGLARGAGGGQARDEPALLVVGNYLAAESD